MKVTQKTLSSIWAVCLLAVVLAGLMVLQRVTNRTALLEATKELESFSYSVCHNLRAPRRAVNRFAGIVLEEFSSSLPVKGRHYLERIHLGGQRLGELIDDLLAFSRSGRQSMSRRKVDSDQLVQSAPDELEPQRTGGQIRWDIGPLPVIQGDPVLLKQVWVNLISNAIKYTRGREPTVIEIGANAAMTRTSSSYVTMEPASTCAVHTSCSRVPTLAPGRQIRRPGRRTGHHAKPRRAHLAKGEEDSDAVFRFTLGAETNIRMKYIVKPVSFELFGAAVQELGMYWLLLNQPPTKK